MCAFEWVDYHAFGASIGGELSWLSTTVGRRCCDGRMKSEGSVQNWPTKQKKHHKMNYPTPQQNIFYCRASV